MMPSRLENSYSIEVFKFQNEIANWHIEWKAVEIIIVINGRFNRDYTHFIWQFGNAFHLILNLLLNHSLRQVIPYPVKKLNCANFEDV